MPHLTESIAALTNERDRDHLELQIIQVIADLIRPQRLSLYKLLQHEDSLLVLPRVDYRDGALTVKSCPDKLETLSPVTAYHQAELLLKRTDAVFVKVDEGVKALIPVSNGRSAVGWLEMVTRHTLSDEHGRLLSGLLKIFANHLAILDYSEHDSLTGLMNRKTYDDSFMKLLAHSHRLQAEEIPAELDRRFIKPQPLPYWLGVIDIDFFKRINDKFGHLYGDEVLVLLARLMRSVFRANDRLYRFGGEEFVVVLDRVSSDNVAPVFERLRAKVEAYLFPQVGQVTVSLGFTMILPGDAPGSAFDRADAALYYAKQHGRNQVQHYENLIENGLLHTKKTNEEVELF